MKYAIVRIKGTQYKLTEGDELSVPHHRENEEVAPEVLFINNDGKVSLGDPLLKNAKISLESLGSEAGKKMHIRKFKAKSRYRRKIGFRPEFTRVKVNKISLK